MDRPWQGSEVGTTWIWHIWAHLVLQAQVKTRDQGFGMNAFDLMGRTEGGHMKGLRNFLCSYSANEGFGESRVGGGTKQQNSKELSKPYHSLLQK